MNKDIGALIAAILKIADNITNFVNSGITGLISAGANVTITGTGTTIDPYIISSAGGGAGSNDGWIAYNTVIPTRASADDPTYVLTFAGVDLTSQLCEGMKVKWTQNSIVRYGFINKAPVFSTNTTVSILTICNDSNANFDVLDTASFAISNFSYSTDKCPFGFPIDPIKWTVETKSTTDDSQATPTNGTWYNPGSRNIQIPVGSWNVGYQAMIKSQVNGSALVLRATLSTTNNSESDTDFTSRYQSNGATSTTFLVFGPVGKNKNLTLTTKATYYLNGAVGVASTTDITFEGASGGTTIIRAICNYL